MKSISTFCVAVCTVIAVGVISTPAVATDVQPDNPQLGPVDPLAGTSIHDLSAQTVLGTTVAWADESIELARLEDDGPIYQGDVYGYKTKSPRTAFLKSFLVPGWGQWYNGNRIKPFVFLGLEAAGWLGWSNFRSNGRDKEDIYRAYADTSWDKNAYFTGLDNAFDFISTPDDLHYLDTTTYRTIVDNEVFFHVFSHHAFYDSEGKPVERNTYYENIGKYDQFQYGWKDFDVETDTTLELQVRRAKYVKMRDDANKEFSKASTVLILTIGNHLLAGFEAAIGAKRYNRALDQFGVVEPTLRLTRSPTTGKLMPRLAVNYRF